MLEETLKQYQNKDECINSFVQEAVYRAFATMHSAPSVEYVSEKAASAAGEASNIWFAAENKHRVLNSLQFLTMDDLKEVVKRAQAITRRWEVRRKDDRKPADRVRGGERGNL